MSGRLLSALNLGGVLCALGLGLVGLTWAERRQPRAVAAQSSPTDSLHYVTLANGERALLDASGATVPLHNYQRVASASTISDALLLEFAAPSQIASFTSYSAGNEVFGYRYAGKPQVDALKNIEGVLALAPDLLLVSTLSSGARLERLRETGLNVFSLGEMRGVASFLSNARAVAALVGRPELGELYATSYLRRLRSIAVEVPLGERRTAAQLTYYGNKIYGSGRDTSYNDVLTYAGLIDVGAKQYHGWPAWSPEQVLDLDPDVIVTRTGMGQQLCTRPALSSLRACKLDSVEHPPINSERNALLGNVHSPGRSHLVELPDALINDPGPGMLLSAERIYDAVYGPQHPAP